MIVSTIPRISMVSMSGDFSQAAWPIGCLLVLASYKDRYKEKKFSVLLRKEIMNKLVVDLLQQKGLGC